MRGAIILKENWKEEIIGQMLQVKQTGEVVYIVDASKTWCSLGFEMWVKLKSTVPNHVGEYNMYQFSLDKLEKYFVSLGKIYQGA